MARRGRKGENMRWETPRDVRHAFNFECGDSALKGYVFVACAGGRCEPLACHAQAFCTQGVATTPLGAASRICVTTAAGAEMTLAVGCKMPSHNGLRRQFAARRRPLVVSLCHKQIYGPAVASRFLTKGY